MAGGREPGWPEAEVVCGPGSAPPATTGTGFTIVEVLVVMTIILVLAGLILATSSYVHNKGARCRTEADIAAMSAALENYKADHGIYPNDNSVDPRTVVDPSHYQTASLQLYKSLSGDLDADRQPNAGVKSYLSFKAYQLSPATGNVQFITDPFRNSYGYSTAGEAGGGRGYNPTFDLWSTAGSSIARGKAGWVKNW
jgi:prepilin-type N-terminal cleavage/methylation domain-containing protein